MKERMLQYKSTLQNWCLQHKLLAIFLLMQGFVVLYFVAQLFAPKTVIEFPLEYFVATGQSSAVSVGQDGLVIQNEEDNTNAINMPSDVFALPRGAYLLTVDYKSVYNLAQPSSSIYEESVAVLLETSPTQKLFVQMENLLLKDSARSATGHIWVSYGERVDTAQLVLCYNGVGRTEISSICITEQVAYRWVTLLGVCIAFALLNAVLYILLAPQTIKNQSRLRVIKIFFAIFAISVVANIPLFADYLYNGADLMFHTVRIDAVAKELSYGQFPVRIMTDMVNGYGYVNSLFYCDIFLYLPALLYNCGLQLRMAYQVYAFMVSFVTCAVSYYCFKKISRSTLIAITGAAVYTLSSYRLANIYTRAGVGEYTALAFLPLIVLGLWNIYRVKTPRYQDWLPLSIGVVGVVQSHVLSLEIVLMFLGGCCLLLLKQSLQLARLKSFVCAGLLCMGLSAWFWVPFLQSLIQMDLQYTTAVSMEIQSRGLDMLELLNLGGANYRLGWGVLIGVVLAIYYMVQHKGTLAHQWEYNVVKFMLGIGVLATVLTLDVFPWNAIGYGITPMIASLVNVIQFPWRYLVVAVVCFTFITVIALMWVKQCHARWFQAIICAILAINIGFTGLYYIDFTEYAEKLSMNELGTLTMPVLMVGAGEYLLIESDTDAAMSSAAVIASDAIQVADYKKIDGIAYLTVENTSADEQVVSLPIWNYPNYQATDAETGEQLAITTGENNRLQVSVAQGYAGTVQVRYVSPWYWHLAELVSLGSWLFVAGMAIYQRRKKGNTAKVM